MKLLHTSDWHLGRALYGRKRYEEQAAFLQWLADTIAAENIDVLLVAGDVFDTSMPSNRAQELYYRFIHDAAGSCCRHIVIVAGNHDSPSFLTAPRQLLKALNVHVVGAAAENPEEEVLVLQTADGWPSAIVCAVPYLRDKDIRLVEPGETMEEKNAKLVDGVRRHYAAVCAAALRKRRTLAEEGRAAVPIIASGHLFTAGGTIAEGDGVRELYVGALAHVNGDVFPDVIDYLALGHLHIPQCVGNKPHIRYSGAPIAMGYGEAGQDKKVVTVEFSDAPPEIREITVPCFQPLVKIAGGLSDIQAAIERLKEAESTAWVEVEYTGSEIIGNLRERIDEAVTGSALEIRRIKNKRMIDRVMAAAKEEETLDDLDVGDVFERCLDRFEVPLEDRADLKRSHNEIIAALQEEDAHAQ